MPQIRVSNVRGNFDGLPDWLRRECASLPGLNKQGTAETLGELLRRVFRFSGGLVVEEPEPTQLGEADDLVWCNLHVAFEPTGERTGRVIVRARDSDWPPNAGVFLIQRTW